MRRTRSIRVPVTEAERTALCLRAVAAGLAVSEYVRRAALGEEAEGDGRVARRLAREERER
jgi:hypothetical protein